LDTSRDGKLKFNEFKSKLKSLGFTTNVNACLRTLFDLIDDAGDESSKRSITAEEMSFLDKWECPDYLWSEPDFDAKEPFLRLVVQRYNGNPLLAWRIALDHDSSMRVSYYEFMEAYKNLVNKSVFLPNLATCVPSLFRAFNKSNTGWISLKDFDQPMYERLAAFTVWAKGAFGKVSLMCKALMDGEDCNRVTFRHFWQAMKEHLGMAKDEAWLLFEGLSMESRRSGTIRPDELFFLDKWDFLIDAEEEVAWENMMKDVETQLKGGSKETIEPLEGVARLNEQ
jgi:hypothetical protein